MWFVIIRRIYLKQFKEALQSGQDGCNIFGKRLIILRDQKNNKIQHKGKYIGKGRVRGKIKLQDSKHCHSQG
jgi:hypothetical protein